MSGSGDPRVNDADEDVTTSLLRLAGPRAQVPSTRAARVRSAVRVEWAAGIQRRTTRRRVALTASLAAIAAATLLPIGRSLFREHVVTPGGPIAVVAHVDGRPGRLSDGPDPSIGTQLHRGNNVRIGQWIETGDDSRVALRYDDGTSVRLDSRSRLRLLSRNGIELSTGAVYVDTGREDGRFEVRTALATAHDIGTQFEVRLIGETMRLRVRTGVVALKQGARSISARPGTEITLSAAGAVTRPIPAEGSEWAWIARVSPPLEMEGRSLATFLEHLAREQGWRIQYSDAGLAREAAGIALHGSVSGLAPDAAIAVAVTASGLRYRIENGEVTVFRVSAGDARKPGRHP